MLTIVVENSCANHASHPPAQSNLQCFSKGLEIITKYHPHNYKTPYGQSAILICDQ